MKTGVWTGWWHCTDLEELGKLEVGLRVALSKSYSERCYRYICLKQVLMCLLEIACMRGSKWVSFYLLPTHLPLSPVLCLLLLLLRQRADTFFTCPSTPSHYHHSDGISSALRRQSFRLGFEACLLVLTVMPVLTSEEPSLWPL